MAPDPIARLAFSCLEGTNIFVLDRELRHRVLSVETSSVPTCDEPSGIEPWSLSPRFDSRSWWRESQSMKIMERRLRRV